MTKKRLAGFKNIYVAKNNGDGTFAAPIRIVGGKSLEAELNFESVQFYADDEMDVNEPVFSGGEGTLAIAGLSNEDMVNLFGNSVNAGGVSVKSGDVIPEVALLFERSKIGTTDKMLYAIYGCKFNPASLQAATKEGNMEEEVDELAFTVREDATNGIYYRMDTGAVDADQTKVAAWYTAVQVPTEAVGGATIQAQKK